MIKNYLFSIILILSCYFLNAQLNPGDIAFVQYNADGTDNFAFVALVDISVGEVISFTDNEENDLEGGEGTIIWTAPVGGVSCGSIVSITTTPSTNLGSVIETGDLNFAGAGDSILAYQGSTTSPIFIAALSNDGGSWGGANDGNLPAGLLNGTSAIAISPEIDNCAYNGTLSVGSRTALLASINDNSNWTLTNDATQQTYSGGDFIVSDCAASDPNLSITGTTDHGSSCISNPASTITYTITNNGTLPANGLAVSSNNAQFVVSGLSSTTIAPSGTATFNVIFTPSTTGAQSATLSVTSTTLTSNSPSLTLDGTGISVPTLTQPTNQNVTIPATATFSVSSSNAVSYQWQVSTNGGTTWTNATGGTGATAASYTTGATSAAMDGYLYRCRLTNTCGITTSNAVSLNLTNASPNNVINISSCFEDTSVTLEWDAPASGATPTGYVVFARAGGTDPVGTKTDANTYTANTNFTLASPVTPATLGKVVYKGTATSTVVTGLTEDTNYSFTAYAYVGESLTGWAAGATAGSTVTNGLAQGDVRNLVATPLTNQVTLNWLNPTPISCWNDILIVANQGPVSFTPSGNGSAYTANAVYTSPNQVVYKASGNSLAVTGLTNGLNYCFKAFIRRGNTWTEGVEVCAVPSLTYCNAAGNTTFATGITGVSFNTINNNGTSASNSYTDYTSISTSVELGEFHNLGVTVNIDGSVDVFTRVWIDWNQDGSFNSSGEEYDLGTASNPSSTIDLNTATSNSPISVEIPNNAAIGATRMRVATRYNEYPTSCQTGYSGEVEDYTIIITRPSNAEINIKGNNISIPNGFNAPFGLNNTLFGATDVGSPGPEKIFFVENIGLTSLTLSGTPRVELIGAHAGDFTVTLQPASSISSGSDSEFRIQFFPSADGTRTATVRIQNSDSDENPYEFDIQGSATCSTLLTSAIWPVEGPELTEITITSATDLTGASASLNGLALTTLSSNATELVVAVPTGASSGNLSVLFSTGCTSVNSFTVIDNLIGGCETATASIIPSNLFISEVSDATSGSSSIIELFNGTAGAIDLSDYSIRVFNNGSSTPSTTANLVGTLASGNVHVISIGTTTCDLAASGLGAGLPHQTFNSAGGINFNLNSSDAIELYNSTTGTSIDVFGELGSNSWANSLTIGTDGVNYRRQNTATLLPSTNFDITEWDEIDWTTCSDSVYDDFGTYDFSLGVPPSVSLLNSPVFDCTNTVQISITATEGVPSGLGLAYQWYYLAPNTSTFVAVPNNADFDNVNTATLDLINPINYDNYQFYCQVRENSATCYKASNAVKLEIETTVWNGTWSTPPTSDKVAILNAPYDTASGGFQISFSACNLIINNVLLNIADGDFVEVGNNLTVIGANGAINIEPEGSFVQINDFGTVNATIPTNLKVNKLTAPSNYWYEYTYWSSPVFEETPEVGLANSNPNRRYQFDAWNFRDSFYETDNDNNPLLGPGVDDIDDAAPYDWQPISSVFLIPGVGYAATHDPTVFASTPGCPGTTCRINYIFSGLFNNGEILVPLYRNDDELGDTNWNFVGNPYPSAISADTFLATNFGVINQSIPEPNPVIEGAIYLWSQNTEPQNDANGNQNLNFSQSDYAIINGTGQTAAQSPGGEGVVPSRFIPSGQGFFIAMANSAAATQVSPTPVPGEDIQTADLIFNNAMRVSGNNNQFFRSSATQDASANKLWLNLTTDNGVFSQILMGYLDHATDTYDGMYYDAPRNSSTDVNSIIYTTIPDVLKKFAIQGKNASSLTIDETIPLGFYTAINEPTVYTLSIAQLEGEFMTGNSIYVIDYLTNSIHNLSTSNYSFTSAPGDYTNRFEIVFTPTTLSVNEQQVTANDLSITEHADGTLEFKIGHKNLSITTVEILDVLGRQIYKVKGSHSTEVYNFTNLSKAAYIAKVTLSNGQMLSKKAVKQH
jgi:hypothetical protein